MTPLDIHCRLYGQNLICFNSNGLLSRALQPVSQTCKICEFNSSPIVLVCCLPVATMLCCNQTVHVCSLTKQHMHCILLHTNMLWCVEILRCSQVLHSVHNVLRLPYTTTVLQPHACADWFHSLCTSYHVCSPQLSSAATVQTDTCAPAVQCILHRTCLQSTHCSACKPATPAMIVAQEWQVVHCPLRADTCALASSAVKLAICSCFLNASLAVRLATCFCDTNTCVFASPAVSLFFIIPTLTNSLLHMQISAHLQVQQSAHS